MKFSTATQDNQSTIIESLETALDYTEGEEQRLHTLHALIEFYTFTNIREAQKLLAEQYKLLQKFQHPELLLYYHVNTAIIENQVYNFKLSDIHFQHAVNIVEDEGNVSQQIEVYIDYVGTLINLNEIDKALPYIDKAHRLLASFPDDILYARLICREAYLNWHISDFDRTAELLFKSDKFFEGLSPKSLKIKDVYFKTLIHVGFGLIYLKKGNNVKSVESYLKAVELCENAGIRSRLAWYYQSIGQAYMAIHDYDNAQEFFTKVSLIPDDISQSARAYATANLGYCHFDKGNYEEALKMYNYAEGIYKRKANDFANLSTVARYKGLLYDACNKFKRAETKFLEAFEYAKLAKNPNLQAVACRNIAEFYADRNDFRNAYKFELMHSEFGGIVYEESNSIKINELEFKYEAERRRKESEMLRLQATSLQLKALRAQMNPHFMFNALNSLQNYISNEFASKYLAKFAKLMRMSLDYSEMEIISLEKEIEFLEDYLLINQKLRFEDRLQYKITVDEELEDDIIGVPTMIVQPYIENAIEHGIKPQRGGLIKIDFKLMDDYGILCTIEDNGIGRVKALELQRRAGHHHQHKSRGTSITEKRLELLHSDRKDSFSVKIIDLEDPLSKEPAGTRVEILIPIVEMPYRNMEE
jgi:two-component system, LytTR family, sensor kinase